jgi:hypothetical protein
VFFVYGEHGQGGSETRPNKGFYATAREPKQIWEVPNGQHIGRHHDRAGGVRAAYHRLPRRRPPEPEMTRPEVNGPMTIDPVHYARRSATLGVLSLSIVIPASTHHRWRSW